MVHEKYIKRGSKVFGPYLYQNYRENGKTKTKYLGKANKRTIRKKNLRVNKNFFILAVILVILVLIVSLFLLKGEIYRDLKGKLPSERFDVFVGIVGNRPPEILNLSEEILVCENTALSYFFNVSDADGVEDLAISMIPLDPFFVSFIQNFSATIAEYEIFSGILDKNDINARRIGNEEWAVYPEIISVTDGIFVDSVETNITIIGVNNAPEIENIGIQTVEVWIYGDNTIFEHQVQVEDKEDGNQDSGKLDFNLTFLGSEPFFNISKNGTMFFNATDRGDLVGAYELRVCVNDSGLENPHLNISFCGQDGSSITVCDDFDFVVTNENRAPNIIAYYPENLTLNVEGTDVLYFNVTAYDPDWNITDIYWYIDNVSEKYDNSTLFSEFEYSFGCGVSGNYTTSVVVTDGLLNDSVQWNLSVKYVGCPPPGRPGTTGGAGGGLFCEEDWACEEWQQCRNLKKAYELGEISKEYELLIRKRCELFNYTEDVCGFQLRECIDFNYCDRNFSRPGIIRECYYTEEPNCTDNIKNCHHGACEILRDCGGPCPACPTCSDGIQNQNEEGIDCGGPCKACKEFPLKPMLFKSIVMYSLIALFILAAILVIEQIVKYKRFKKVAEKRTRYSVFIFLLIVSVLLFFANIYIMGVAEVGRIPRIEDMDFLASYNLVNSFVKTLRFFLISGVLITENSKLVIWDATEVGFPNRDKFSICEEYCVEKEKPSASLWTIKFYANYTNLSDNPLGPTAGSCEIRFEDYLGGYGEWNSMSYNSVSELWEYLGSFNYKGNYDFEVNCTSEAISNVGQDDFIIINTKPYILQTGEGYIDFDKNGYKDVLQCIEDSICYYNFSANVSEDDVNDILIFSAAPGSVNPLTDFFINETTGILEVRVNHSSFTGAGKKVELSVRDTESLESALLEVDVQDVNDKPVFINLENQTLIAGDLFEYVISVEDEENNIPFKFNISFLNCSEEIERGNCTLFTNSDYSTNEQEGEINISFIPVENDIGSYIINFSVMDNSSLGNQTTSQIVNFSVNIPIWNESVVLEHFLIEDAQFYLNLSENVTQENVTFSYSGGFYSFNLTSEGIINFTPIDQDVGFHEVEIIASSVEASSAKIFNFTIQNINDDPYIQRPLQVNGASIDGASNIEGFENNYIEIFLFVDDDDFLIPEEQKSFYDENLSINLSIEGPNTTLFEFVFVSLILENRARYDAVFIPRNLSVGNYNITINVTDKSNSSDFLLFNLTIFDRDYDVPLILYPGSSYEFNLKENITSNLTFMANHTVGDNLTYRFYINDELGYSLSYYGDNRNLTWSFTPNFTDETYEEKGNLTLVVLNPFFNELNVSRTWNLTIEHTNAPVEFIRDIGDKTLPYTHTLEIDLRDYFFDIDHADAYYRQNVSFFITSNLSNLSNIVIGPISENWTFVLFSSIHAPFLEVLNITANDLNETNNASNMTSVVSNNFIVEFIPPERIRVPQPTSGGGATIPISLKLIMPGSVSAYEYEKIEIPLRLVNSGKRSFYGLTLSSMAFKDGNVAEEVATSLDKYKFKSLRPGQEENLTLTVFFGTDKVGDYEVLVNVSSRSPRYTDWGKIHINLQKINESAIMELILFTEEFIVENPECIEIREVLDEAKVYFEEGNFQVAREKTEEAITACKESISQAAMPKKRSKFFRWSLYFILAIVAAFVIGILYYFLKRRGLQGAKNI